MRIVFHPPLSTISLINLVRNRFGCWGKREGGKDQILGLSPHSPFHSFVYNLRRNRHPLKAKRDFPLPSPYFPPNQNKKSLFGSPPISTANRPHPKFPEKTVNQLHGKTKITHLDFYQQGRTVPPLFLTD